MRLLFVVQRYGPEASGGAERAARQFAVGMAGRGHEVTVATSTALSYVDWAPHYPAGSSEDEGGVRVERFEVERARDVSVFGPLNGRVVNADPPLPMLLQESWMQLQGPYTPGLVSWLSSAAGGFDAAVFCTYLYWPIWAGLRVLSGRVPTALLPFAHDEPYIRMPLFEQVFRWPDALGFLTPEEQAVVQSRFGARRPSAVVGLGIDVDVPRDDSRITDRPYLLALGRVDPGNKGLDELFDFFTAYKERNPGPLALVVMGEPVRPLPPHPDVIATGFVDEPAKHAALAGAMALVHPSYFESFSIVLCEAWAQGRPALVQGRCAVLAGQARRSGGGLPYTGFAEFEAGVDLLLSDRALGDAMGAAGRSYVASRYTADRVLGRLERLLHLVVRS